MLANRNSSFGLFTVSLYGLLLVSLVQAQVGSTEQGMASLAFQIDGPSDCAIFINNRRLVKSDNIPYSTGDKLPPLPEGRYSITLAKTGYKDLSVVSQLTRNSPPLKGKMVSGKPGILQEGYWGSVKVDEMRPKAKAGFGEQKLLKLFSTLTDLMARNRVSLTAESPVTNKEPDFVDVPFEGSLLIGIRYRSGEYVNAIEVLKSVQPIFLSSRGQFLGKNHGIDKGVEKEVVANEGYAVGGMIAKSGQVCDAIQLVFMRITPNGLNPNDFYSTGWLGGDGRGGGKPQMLSGLGKPVVGIAGRAPGALATLRLAVIQ